MDRFLPLMGQSDAYFIHKAIVYATFAALKKTQMFDLSGLYKVVLARSEVKLCGK